MHPTSLHIFSFPYTSQGILSPAVRWGVPQHLRPRLDPRSPLAPLHPRPLILWGLYWWWPLASWLPMPRPCVAQGNVLCEPSAADCRRTTPRSPAGQSQMLLLTWTTRQLMATKCRPQFPSCHKAQTQGWNPVNPVKIQVQDLGSWQWCPYSFICLK